MNQIKKKIKLNKVREIIASRLRDDLRQPKLLRSAIQQGKKERESGITIFTQRVQSDKPAIEVKKLSANTPINNPNQTMKNFTKPVSISKMIGK